MKEKKRQEPDELDEYRLRDIVAGKTKPSRVRTGMRTVGEIILKLVARVI